VDLLPHLPKVEQPDDRHGEADDEQTLEEAVVAQSRRPIANGIVEYVVVEPFFVIAPVVLQEVGEPLAPGPILGRLCRKLAGLRVLAGSRYSLGSSWIEWIGPWVNVFHALLARSLSRLRVTGK
jgi:hypothetical protein